MVTVWTHHFPGTCLSWCLLPVFTRFASPSPAGQPPACLLSLCVHTVLFSCEGMLDLNVLISKIYFRICLWGTLPIDPMIA